MHELGLCESILDAVERRAEGRRVARVRVQCGVLNRVDVGSMQQSFDLVGQGSVADGAVLDVVTVPVRLFCEACGGVSETEELVLLCLQCGSGDIRIIGGEELFLESVTFPAQVDLARDGEG